MNQAYLKNILSAKFDFEVWKDLLDKIFPKVEIFTSVAKIADSHVKDGGHVGNIKLDDGRSLAIFRFEVADNIIISRNRKSLRDIAAKYVDQGLIHGALVFYYSQNQDDYRLTFIAKQTYFNENGELVKKETAPKRYTFLLGKNEPCTTAASRLMELADKKSSGSVFLADVTDTFSVERLNKEFFKGYKEQYAKFLKLLEDKKQHRDYVKKLLGRLVFLQFLQKKGWMGVPASNENWEGGDKNYLANLIERYKGNDRILSDVLEPLFFDTLNKERVGDIADSRLGNNIKIPYLNGGLFDKDKIDALDIDFPYSYFEDLMKFFNEYNFTIDENDPDDAEVGVDPEMLGHIFENLLEDNKDKGAFYTPKEIVQYMCRQSVVQYLKTHTHSDLHNAIETLVINKQVDVALQEKDIATNIYNLLRNVKVCDPAIGSGAFPMGVLNVLFHSRQLLYGFRRDTKGFVPEEVKRDIIQNNIFGVDIEQGAVDIARLRFWLSLVVDSEEPNPLPNLDYKIMQGNSLIESFSGIDLSRIAGVKKKGKVSKSTQLILGLDSIDCEKNLQLLMKQYFSINDHAKKNDLRRDINYYVKGLLINSLGGTPSELEHLEKLDCSANEEFFLWHTWFKDIFDQGGFDIVIGNPPYNELRDIEISMQNALKNSKYYKDAKGGRLNLFQFFYPLAIDISRNNGIVVLITQNSILAEDSALGNRKLFFSETDILAIDSFPERDNKKLRVFESVKMSVCICTLRKNNRPNCFNIIPINVWHSKFMSDKHNLNISVNEILEMYPDDLIIPISSNEKFAVLKEIMKKHQYSINASAGEIDMTKYKNVFNTNRFGTRVVTGAQIQRYHITDNPSQGDIIYIEDVDKPNLSAKRKLEISRSRIVLQRITGVDSKIRIIATLVDGNIFCANSTNYIPVDKAINIKYLLAILNSSLVNFFIKQTSTNTNITAKVLSSIPIVLGDDKIQILLAELVDYITVLKNTIKLSDLVSNLTIASFIEKIIDGCVYELYFGEHMKEQEINIIDSALELIKPISQLTTEKDKSEVILNTFMVIKKTDNPIRNRLDLFTLRSPEILKLIIEG